MLDSPLSRGSGFTGSDTVLRRSHTERDARFVHAHCMRFHHRVRRLKDGNEIRDHCAPNALLAMSFFINEGRLATQVTCCGFWPFVVYDFCELRAGEHTRKLLGIRQQ